MEKRVFRAEMKLQNNNCPVMSNEKTLSKLSSLAIKNFHYREKVLHRIFFMAERKEKMRRFPHQILTKQLKVILGFKSGKG